MDTINYRRGEADRRLNERRSGIDARKDEEKAAVGDRRSSADRRSGFDRRNPSPPEDSSNEALEVVLRRWRNSALQSSTSSVNVASGYGRMRCIVRRAEGQLDGPRLDLAKVFALRPQADDLPLTHVLTHTADSAHRAG